MDFVLGILTGVALMIAYSQYLADRQRKHQREQAKQMFDLIFRRPAGDLEQQLQDAIARDDFEEAARLRDLINKK